ncbi:DUF3990 domain-containing protein [Odoribacter sp. Z80]|uniref:DUF3990 domain-containing protein n=1 Tax=Odoribacter sp. Z80 TaxID=2304575 RepID=UPI001379C104|nr:DUF3990 domain-containing protein [Odoribacter sp. Z80]NCE73050.1 DUF3990 domain-containing protein [Odoribacter sp. Z80]
MILYHGSNMIVEHIDLDKSKPNKDFGKGFYLSESERQATEMATFKSLLLGGKPVVTKFEFDDAVMHDSVLRIKVFDNYSEEWADFVFANREGNDAGQYDIVYGPIANDKIGLQIRKLKDGSIDKAEFLNRLKYMKGITFQYFFGTETAVKYLTKL